MRKEIARLLAERAVVLEEEVAPRLTPAMEPRTEEVERGYLARIEGWERLLDDPGLCGDLMMKIMIPQKRVRAKGAGA